MKKLLLLLMIGGCVKTLEQPEQPVMSWSGFRVTKDAEPRRVEHTTVTKRIQEFEESTQELEKRSQELLKEKIELVKQLELLQADKKTQLYNLVLLSTEDIGLTTNQVLLKFGFPDKTNRTVGRWGVHEQWMYERYGGSYLYFENGVLTGWQN